MVKSTLAAVKITTMRPRAKSRPLTTLPGAVDRIARAPLQYRRSPGAGPGPGRPYEAEGGAVVTVAPGGSSKSEAGGDVENVLISKLVESEATLT
jgi:hypothetical protein